MCNESRELLFFIITSRMQTVSLRCRCICTVIVIKVDSCCCRGGLQEKNNPCCHVYSLTFTVQQCAVLQGRSSLIIAHVLRSCCFFTSLVLWGCKNIKGKNSLFSQPGFSGCKSMWINIHHLETEVKLKYMRIHQRVGVNLCRIFSYTATCLSNLRHLISCFRGIQITRCGLCTQQHKQGFGIIIVRMGHIYIYISLYRFL